MKMAQSRMLDLVKVCEQSATHSLPIRHLLTNLRLSQSQCRIFSLTFNPQRLRLGNKILRQRLRGPALAAWYPRKTVTFRDLQNAYKPLGLTTFDDDEEDREEVNHMFVP